MAALSLLHLIAPFVTPWRLSFHVSIFPEAKPSLHGLGSEDEQCPSLCLILCRVCDTEKKKKKKKPGVSGGFQPLLCLLNLTEMETAAPVSPFTPSASASLSKQPVVSLPQSAVLGAEDVFRAFMPDPAPHPREAKYQLSCHSAAGQKGRSGPTFIRAGTVPSVGMREYARAAKSNPR